MSRGITAVAAVISKSFKGKEYPSYQKHRHSILKEKHEEREKGGNLIWGRDLGKMWK